MTARPALPLALLGLTLAALALSGIGPHDRLTWWMETAPVFIGAALLIATWRRFPLTDLLYVLIFVHALVLMLGAHYTYARVPLGFWAQEVFDLARNHYDRVGHFVQGFVPAIIAREILLRCSPLVRGWWLFAVSAVFCLAISAFYEMIEWWAALIGACTALVLLSKVHDRALARLGIKA
ncbi:MAG TPA: DUF2238 domain-containing protein [Paracoccaceae bacterium]|nr:DUF2238 domain-containing protein [Paracoccaceae bacterium]